MSNQIVKCDVCVYCVKPEDHSQEECHIRAPKADTSNHNRATWPVVVAWRDGCAEGKERPKERAADEPPIIPSGGVKASGMGWPRR